jgi:hypothetical protein
VELVISACIGTVSRDLFVHYSVFLNWRDSYEDRRFDCCVTMATGVDVSWYISRLRSLCRSNGAGWANRDLTGGEEKRKNYGCWSLGSFCFLPFHFSQTKGSSFSKSNAWVYHLNFVWPCRVGLWKKVTVFVVASICWRNKKNDMPARPGVTTYFLSAPGYLRSRIRLHQLEKQFKAFIGFLNILIWRRELSFVTCSG